MKKLLSLILVCALVLSLTATVFADTYIRYTFYSEDGYTYHFGAFESEDTDAGVIINGKEYTLKNADKNDPSKTAFQVAKENGNIFGIGFKTADSFKEDSYVVTPYSRDANNNLVTGQAVTVNKTVASLPTETVPGYVITDDIGNSGVNIHADAAATAIMIKNDGLNAGVKGNQNQLFAGIMKINLTAFSGATQDSNYILNLYGAAGMYNSDSVIDEIKLDVVGVPDLNWSESDTSELNSNITQHVIDKAVIDTVTVPLSASEGAWYKFNVTGYIQQELALGKTSTTIGIIADNENAANDSAETGKRNSLKFTFSSVNNAENKPYIEYKKVDEEYASSDIKTLTVNGEAIDVNKFDANNTLTIKYSYGVEVDSIVATAGDYATVADAVKVDDATYKIVVTAGTGTTKTYTVNFEWAPYPSEDAGTAGAFANGKTVKGAWYGLYNTADNTVINGAYNKETISAYGTMNDKALTVKGTVYKPNVALIKLDLSTLTDLDDTKDTNLYMYGTIKHLDSGTKMKVSIYDVTGEDLTEITIEDLRDLSRWTDGKDLIETAEVATSASTTNASININKLIDKYYGTGIQPVIAIYITPVDKGNGSASQRALLQLNASKSAQTAIKYFKFIK